MLVQRVVMPASRRESWTVLGDGRVPVEPVERYLAYLTDIERSPNTVKAYAHDLKDWFVFLGGRGLDWREVRLEDVGEFVAWLRLPPAGGTAGWRCCRRWSVTAAATTVNRKLSAVSAFYQHAARHGVDLGELLTTWQPAGRRGTAWKPFLHHISKGEPQQRRDDRAEDAAQAPADPDRPRGPGDPGRLRPAAGPVPVRAAVRDRHAGSARRWACVMRTWPPPSARWRWCRGTTTTAPGPSPANRARSRSAPS